MRSARQYIALTLAAASFLAAPARADAETEPPTLVQAIEARLAEDLPRGVTSVLVVDAATGDELVAIRPDELLNPASNVKLISTATALDLLGPEHVFTTRAIAAAPDREGTIASDLYLLGSHDPTLDRRGLAALAARLHAAGVRRLAGDVLVGDGPRRDGVASGRLTVRVRAGRVGQPPAVEITPATDLVVLDVRATTTRRRTRTDLRIKSSAFIDAHGRPRLELVVDGTIRARARTTRRVIVEERAIHAAYLLIAALEDAGVAVDGGVAIAPLDRYVRRALAAGWIPRTLARHDSAPLDEMIRVVNKKSLNGLADRVLMSAVARRQGGRASMSRAIDAMYAWLRRAAVPVDDLLVDTGSGLSYATRMSARQIVAVLGAAIDVDAFRRSLAVAGVDGTLKRRLRRAPAAVRAKTGTLTGIIALSGTIEVDDAPALLFAIITNDHAPRRRRAVRRAHDRIVEALAAYAADRARAHAHARVDASRP